MHAYNIYIYMVNSHENLTIPRQRGHQGSKLKNCLLTIWVFGIKHGVWGGGEISKIGNANINNFLRYDTEEF